MSKQISTILKRKMLSIEKDEKKNREIKKKRKEREQVYREKEDKFLSYFFTLSITLLKKIRLCTHVCNPPDFYFLFSKGIHLPLKKKLILTIIRFSGQHQ